MLNIKIENTSASTVTIVSVERISLNGVEQDSKDNLGTISSGGANEFDNVILDEGDEFVLKVQDTAGKTIGEVRQTRDAVHAKMEGRTWVVKIPADMTPESSDKAANITSR